MKRIVSAALLWVAALALAGCAGDIPKQVVSSEQLRGQVMDAIVQNRDLALQTADRLVASDTLRVAVVNHLLHNKDVAYQVVVRIGTNPDAIDEVMKVAMADSTARAHVMTLMKGMQMAGLK